MQEHGCRVLYGTEKFKCHSKLCLITYKHKNKFSYITQIGTGNYNEKTAKHYTDLSYITTDSWIGAEVSSIFNSLCLGQAPENCQMLLAAPKTLQSGIQKLIQEQTEAAKKGKPAYIGMKMNSLTDRKIIDALMEASAAGVPVELIVRGSCCVVGGISKKTKNIQVHSIVGRFLEHSRIYLFGLGEHQKIYMGSADLMTRNTLHRVEVLTPVLGVDCKERLRQLFAVQWADNQNCRIQQADGTYVRRMPFDGEEAFNTQEYLYQMAYEEREARLPEWCGQTLCLKGEEGCTQ